MPIKTDMPNGFHSRPLASGNVEFIFVVDGEEIVRGQCTPDELGSIITGMLSSANSAAMMSDSDRSIKSWGGPAIIPVSYWQAGYAAKLGETVLTAQTGDTVIAFQVPPTNLRTMARFLISAEWKTPGVSIRRALRMLTNAVAGELRGFSVLCRDRMAAALRRTSVRLKSLASGQSLRKLVTIRLGPGIPVPILKPANECIYCGAKVYSERPGIRRHPLGGEHIVPEGLGGKLELPLASCQSCEEITGATVEGDVLGNTLKALRAHLKLRKPGGNPFPKSLPIGVSEVGKKDRIVNIEIDDYPIMLNVPGYAEPGFFRNASEEFPLGNGFYIAMLRWDQRTLLKKYGITSFTSARWDNAMFSRMLAKIGHSLAVAILGKDKFAPLLKPLILSGDRMGNQYIGGEPFLEKTRKELHTVALGYRRYEGKDYVVATIRLFAQHQTPTYTVVVGESLESAIAKFRRVFSRRISSIARR
jgi:hypothetical protein